jgi:large subunit ribosomal protein L3
VVARKTVEKHGYDALQVGFGERRKSRTTKPLEGQFVKAGVEPTQYLREVRVDGEDLDVGSVLTVAMFKPGDRVDVTGVSRGLGFQGGMKRHNFQGANKTHGQSDRWRAPGSIGQSSYPSRVFKGQRMAGRMGREKKTVLNVSVVRIYEKENLMLVRGSVPGFRGSLLKIRTTNRGK